MNVYVIRGDRRIAQWLDYKPQTLPRTGEFLSVPGRGNLVVTRVAWQIFPDGTAAVTLHVL